jgi:putative transposase
MKVLPYKRRSLTALEARVKPLTTTEAPVMADATNNTIILSYKYKLLPTAKQHGQLESILESQRILYNCALEHRIKYYEKTGKSMSYMSQCKEVTELRRDLEYGSIALNIQRWTLKRLDDAFTGFFRRIKFGDKAGFPRFRGKGRWQSFGFNEFSGITLFDNRIKFKGLSGSLRVHKHRELPDGKILSCTLSRNHKIWYICLQMRVACQMLAATGNEVGIDVGLVHLANLSTGEHIPNIRVTKQAAKRLRLASRALARCKKGSKRRQKVKLKLIRCHAKIKNTRSTYLHQVSCKLIHENDLIVVEKLNNKGLASGMLAKHVNDAAWSQLKQNLLYKAAYAGRKVVEVSAYNTSQECSSCHTVVSKKLSERWHCCPSCGLKMDRIVKKEAWDGLTPEECGRKDAQEAFNAMRHILRGNEQQQPNKSGGEDASCNS